MDGIQEAIVLHVLRLTICFCLFAQVVQGADNLTDSVKCVMGQAEKDGRNMSLPVNKYQEEGMKAAKATADVYHSQAFQEKLQCEQKRMGEEVFVDYIGEPDTSREQSIPGKLAVDEKVYLFISSSMPDETVHNYLETLERVDEENLILLMKGFVPGERDTYLIRIAKKDMHCTDLLQSENPEVCERFEIPIKIQPSLFDKYEISQVPALVYQTRENAWKISGDMALDYLLEKINAEAQSLGLAGLVNTLRGS